MENIWKLMADRMGLTQTAFAVYWQYISAEERKKLSDEVKESLRNDLEKK